MATVFPSQASRIDPDAGRPNESAVSAASWPAIFAGAVTAVATTLILVALGSGIGLASVSPWAHSGVSATTFTVMTAIWLIVIQWGSSLVGGYMAGRLRTKWVGVHTHEVFFRDTANGFVTWALATAIGVGLIATSTGAAVGKVVDAASTASAGAAQGTATTQPTGPIAPYDLDKLFRSTAAGTNSSKPDAPVEAAGILAHGIAADGVSSEDRTYLAGLVAARTGLSQEEAQKRVDDAVAATMAAKAKAQAAADAARKAVSATSIFMALSMLIGAFIASAAAALGGKLRDEHP